MCIYLLRDRERESASRGGAERERGRERISSQFCSVSTEPDARLDLRNHKIMT